MADYTRLTAPEQRKAAGRVGRVGILTVEAILEAAEALGPLRDRLAGAVEQSQTPEGAQKRMEAVIAEHQQDSAIGDALFVPMLMADLAGQLMVKGHEAKRVELVGAAQAPNAFLNLPWQEAIAEFKARGVTSEEELATLIRNHAFRSQEARRLLLEQLQQRTKDNLVKALEQGQAFQEFAAAMRETGGDLGITADNPAYLQTVFRTNLQTAYGAGRYRAMQDPDVREARSYVQYRTAGDARVRDEHALLDGKVFRIGSKAHQRIAPPNGFNCRCSAVTLSQEDVDAEGLKVSRVVPKDSIPPEGFDGPPVALLEREIET